MYIEIDPYVMFALCITVGIMYIAKKCLEHDKK